MKEKLIADKPYSIGWRYKTFPENHPARKCGHKSYPAKEKLYTKQVVFQLMEEYAKLKKK
jgi:hypothetical protein